MTRRTGCRDGAPHRNRPAVQSLLYPAHWPLARARGQPIFAGAEARVLYELVRRDQPTASELPGPRSRRRLSEPHVRRFRAVTGLPPNNPRRPTGAKACCVDAPRPQDLRTDRSAHAGRNSRVASVGSGSRSRAGYSSRCDTSKVCWGAPPRRGSPYILRPHARATWAGSLPVTVCLYGTNTAGTKRSKRSTAEIVGGLPAQLRSGARTLLDRGAERPQRRLRVRGQSDSARIAQLRLLLVEPEARGLGIGLRLVEECIRFARQTGYRSIMLWTHSNLDSARARSTPTGFRLS